MSGRTTGDRMDFLMCGLEWQLFVGYPDGEWT